MVTAKKIRIPIKPKIIQKPYGLWINGIIGVFMPKIEAIKLIGRRITEIMVRNFIISFKRKEIRDSLVLCKALMFSFKFSKISQRSLVCSKTLEKYTVAE